MLLHRVSRRVAPSSHWAVAGCCRGLEVWEWLPLQLVVRSPCDQVAKVQQSYASNLGSNSKVKDYNLWVT
jgi:hypothetical protein